MKRRVYLAGCAATLVGYGAVAFDVFVAQAPVSAAAFLAVMDAGGYAGGAFTRVVRPDNDHGTPSIAIVQAKARASGGPGGGGSARAPGGGPRDGVGTATGAEFFVCFGDQPALDYGGLRNPDGQGFAAFGRVVLGMDVMRRIWISDASGQSTDRYTAGQMLTSPVTIVAASRGRA